MRNLWLKTCFQYARVSSRPSLRHGFARQPSLASVRNDNGSLAPSSNLNGSHYSLTTSNIEVREAIMVNDVGNKAALVKDQIVVVVAAPSSPRNLYLVAKSLASVY